MYSSACLVSVAHPKSKNKDASCSGILISGKHGFVLSHSCIISSLLTERSEKELRNNEKINGRDFHFPKARVTIAVTSNRKKVSTDADKELNPSGKYKTALLNVASAPLQENDRKCYSGSIEYIWKAVEFAKSINKLFPRHEDWKFADEPPGEKTKDENTIEPEKVALLMPYFILIKLDDWPTNNASSDPMILSPRSLRRGMEIYTVGTPFGSLSPAVFMNSISHGVVSNITSPGHDLFLTDARCIPGSEGGLVFTKHKRQDTIAGMVVAPLCWKANEWIGLTICCSIHEIIHSLSTSVDVNISMDSITLPEKKSHSSFDELPHEDVVLVQCGGTWGSGVLLSDGCDNSIVITCSHVIKNNERVRVRHDFPKRRWFEAERLFATPNGLVYDVAILHVHGLQSDNIWTDEVKDTSLDVGEDLYMIGHGVFGKERHLSASVSKGILSKVVTHHGAPVMIQSTCAVHPGASGGPLINNKGKIVGIVACNAKDTVSGANFPHVNLSIPMQVLAPAIDSYFQTKDIEAFKDLIVSDSLTQKIWDLKANNLTAKL